MKFTSAIIALSVVAALAQAAGPLDSVLAPLSGVTNGVTNGVAQKRDLPGGLTDAAGGAAQNLPLAGTIMNLVSGATSEATAPNGVNVVKRDGLSDLLALANGLADTTGTGAKALQKRDAKINIDAKLKAAVELCLHAITDVKVKAELVAQILAKVKAELKIDIDAELEAKLLVAIKASVEAHLKITAAIKAQVEAALELIVKADVNAVAKVVAKVTAKITADITAQLKAIVAALNVNVGGIKDCLKGDPSINANVDIDLAKLDAVAKLHLDIQAVVRALLDIDIKASIDAAVKLALRINAEVNAKVHVN
ncbi:MAG: hypothetical protein JOS17DRAFT_730707 [Linnemannia elongata]|nr:MAG: hypothetical protein JOS17DRAFT_730707 [Linnemannia elongata]